MKYLIGLLLIGIVMVSGCVDNSFTIFDGERVNEFCSRYNATSSLRTDFSCVWNKLKVNNDTFYFDDSEACDLVKYNDTIYFYGECPYAK